MSSCELPTRLEMFVISSLRLDSWISSTPSLANYGDGTRLADRTEKRSRVCDMNQVRRGVGFVSHVDRGSGAARELGNYELVEKLGEGGMGEVWRAEHRLLARPAAVKLD